MKRSFSIVAALAGFASLAHAEAERILPDSVNIAVIPGSELYDPCEIQLAPEAAARFRPPHAQCVTIPMSRSLELQNAYVRALREAGWSFEGGAGPAFFFERPAATGNCVEALDFVGLPRGAEGDHEAGAVFVFALRPELTCREPAQ